MILSIKEDKKVRNSFKMCYTLREKKILVYDDGGGGGSSHFSGRSSECCYPSKSQMKVSVPSKEASFVLAKNTPPSS